jgi:hypothetical protein
MAQMTHAAAWAVMLTLGATTPATAFAAGTSGIQDACSAKTKGPYGFQCQGYSNVGAGLEPVTFVGTVAGSDIGVFDGYGTFSSSLGSSRQHAVGQAVFQDKTCFGHIQYQITLVLPNGSEIDVGIPPLDIDFTVVNGGFEILGTPNALPGATGAAVPRMSCRLVRIKSQD